MCLVSGHHFFWRDRTANAQCIVSPLKEDCNYPPHTTTHHHTPPHTNEIHVFLFSIPGKGSFATVFLGDLRKVQEDTSGTLISQISDLPALIAVKMLKKRLQEPTEPGGADVSQAVRDTIERAELEEMEVCSKYRHRNLCCMLAWSSDGSLVWFVL